MHGEEGPGGGEEGVCDGGKGRAMEEGVEFVAEGGREGAEWATSKVDTTTRGG